MADATLYIYKNAAFRQVVSVTLPPGMAGTDISEWEFRAQAAVQGQTPLVTFAVTYQAGPELLLTAAQSQLAALPAQGVVWDALGRPPGGDPVRLGGGPAQVRAGVTQWDSGESAGVIDGGTATTVATEETDGGGAV